MYGKITRKLSVQLSFSQTSKNVIFSLFSFTKLENRGAEQVLLREVVGTSRRG
jgi:hypothetical protein